MSDTQSNQAPAPTIYGLARGALERALTRLQKESAKRANLAEQGHHSELVRQHYAGHGSGLDLATSILQDEINRLPKEGTP